MFLQTIFTYTEALVKKEFDIHVHNELSNASELHVSWHALQQGEFFERWEPKLQSNKANLNLKNLSWCHNDALKISV